MAPETRRDPSAPLERLVRLLAVLWTAGAEGVPGPRLLAVGAYGSSDVADRKRQLGRDLSHLDTLGYDIRNVSPEGAEARYRLVARDNRLRVELTSAQQVELARAAHLAGRPAVADGIGAPAALGVAFSSPTPVRVQTPTADVSLEAVLRAAARRCLLRFGYKGRPRVVHPRLVRSGASGWYLVGREEGQAEDKVFVIARMSEVSIDAPGTAAPAASEDRTSLDPLGWRLDPPVDAVVATTAEHRAQVVAALAVAGPIEESADEVRLTVRVVHRAAFRHRLYELGTRVRLLGPPELRRELLEELRGVAGVGA